MCVFFADVKCAYMLNAVLYRMWNIYAYFHLQGDNICHRWNIHRTHIRVKFKVIPTSMLDVDKTASLGDKKSDSRCLVHLFTVLPLTHSKGHRSVMQSDNEDQYPGGSMKVTRSDWAVCCFTLNLVGVYKG